MLIGPNGHAVAQLTRLDNAAKPRKLGFFKGQLVVPDDFDAPLPDQVLEDFQGGR